MAPKLCHSFDFTIRFALAIHCYALNAFRLNQYNIPINWTCQVKIDSIDLILIVNESEGKTEQSKKYKLICRLNFVPPRHVRKAINTGWAIIIQYKSSKVNMMKKESSTSQLNLQWPLMSLDSNELVQITTFFMRQHSLPLLQHNMSGNPSRTSVPNVNWNWILTIMGKEHLIPQMSLTNLKSSK